MYMLLCCCREEAQKCYCGSANCRGILGGPPPKDNRRAGLYMQMSYVLVRAYMTVVVIFVCLCAGEFGIRRERRRREGVIVDTLDEVSHHATP